MDTERASDRGRDRDRGRDSLDARPASIRTGTVRATLQRGRLGPRVDGYRGGFRSRSRSGSRSRQPRRPPCVHPHGDRAGYFAAWPTRSPSCWLQRELQIEVEIGIAVETASTRTPRPSARGPCGLIGAPLALSRYEGLAVGLSNGDHRHRRQAHARMPALHPVETSHELPQLPRRRAAHENSPRPLRRGLSRVPRVVARPSRARTIPRTGSRASRSGTRVLQRISREPQLELQALPSPRSGSVLCGYSR